MEKSVFIKPSCLKLLTSSAIEVYNRETSGLLTGRRRIKKVGGKEIELVSLERAYPYQTDRRKPTEVEHGNLSAVERLMGLIRASGEKLIGGFHSHIWPYEHKLLRLSKEDVDFIREERKIAKRNGNYQLQDWLEVLIGIKKKEYRRRHRENLIYHSFPKKVGVTVRYSRVGYYLSISAYEVSGFEEGGRVRVSEIGLYNQTP